jgi:hypothetical protein
MTGLTTIWGLPFPEGGLTTTGGGFTLIWGGLTGLITIGGLLLKEGGLTTTGGGLTGLITIDGLPL